MKTGLLWFDDDPRKGLEEKVQRAATHYERKYGRAPDLCYVHPGVLGDDGKVKKAGNVEIRTGRSVLPCHFWLGVIDRNKKKATMNKARHSKSAPGS